MASSSGSTAKIGTSSKTAANAKRPAQSPPPRAAPTTSDESVVFAPQTAVIESSVRKHICLPYDEVVPTNIRLDKPEERTGGGQRYTYIPISYVEANKRHILYVELPEVYSNYGVGLSKFLQEKRDKEEADRQRTGRPLSDAERAKLDDGYKVSVALAGDLEKVNDACDRWSDTIKTELLRFYPKTRDNKPADERYMDAIYRGFTYRGTSDNAPFYMGLKIGTRKSIGLKTTFMLPNKKAISWRSLVGRPFRFIPIIGIEYVFWNNVSFTVQFYLANAWITGLEESFAYEPKGLKVSPEQQAALEEQLSLTSAPRPAENGSDDYDDDEPSSMTDSIASRGLPAKH